MVTRIMNRAARPYRPPLAQRLLLRSSFCSTTCIPTSTPSFRPRVIALVNAASDDWGQAASRLIEIARRRGYCPADLIGLLGTVRPRCPQCGAKCRYKRATARLAYYYCPRGHLPGVKVQRQP